MRRSETTLERKEVTFRSWGEWVEYTKKDAPKDAYTTHSVTNDNDFNYGASYADALKFAEFGWADGLKLINPLKQALVQKIANHIPVEEIRLDVTGRSFDMGLVMTGEPECWIDYEDEISSGFKALTIVVNGAYSCGVDTDVVLARGACLAALVDLLEMTKVRCTVILDMGFSADYTYKISDITARVTIKEFDQPLDLNRLAFALAHAASFRRLGFRLLENFPEYHERLGSGYGYPGEVPVDRRGNLYIEQMQYDDKNHWDDPAFAKQWVINQLIAQGINLDGQGPK